MTKAEPPSETLCCLIKKRDDGTCPA